MELINFLDVYCGTGESSIQIPGDFANILHLIYNAIRIGVPIILILVGMLGLGKAITQQKEDEIKKAQSVLVKQAIAAAIVFLMFSLVSLLVSVVAKDLKEGEHSYWSCAESILKEGDTYDCNDGDSVPPTCASIGSSSAGLATCEGGHWTCR